RITDLGAVADIAVSAGDRRSGDTLSVGGIAGLDSIAGIAVIALPGKTVVAGIANPVQVGVGLVGIGSVGTVVSGVGDSVTVAIQWKHCHRHGGGRGVIHTEIVAAGKGHVENADCIEWSGAGVFLCLV